MANLRVTLPVLFAAGFYVRYILISNPHVQKLLESRIEISTPLSSWKRAVEGVTLNEKGISPYDGDIFHETPLALLLYKHIFSLGPLCSSVVFVVCDVIAALLLALSALSHMRNLVKKESKTDNFPESASELLMKPHNISAILYYVAAIYLFSPFTIASCCGKSTAVFLNVLIALFVLLASTGRYMEASVVLGVVSYHSVYHGSLIVPLLIAAYQNFPGKKTAVHVKTAVAFMVFVSTVCWLLYASYRYTGSWHFLMSTYGFTFSVPDLTPNIGLFWYFFTEMFEHFRVFFLWTFQLNVFIYTVPLAVRLRREPMLIIFIHLILISVFKPYPCIGDVGLYLSLLPAWKHLFILMRQSFVIGCVFVSCSLLAPTLWHLWIYSGSANANFYFGITLVFNTGQIFLLIDVLNAFAKREYYLLNGIGTDDGTLLLLRLQ